jgi:hypothetical protein
MEMNQTPEFNAIKDKKPIEIIKDYKNIFLNPFIHYLILECPLEDRNIRDYKKIENAYIVLIKIIMEYSNKFEISLDISNYYEAVNKGLIKMKKVIPIWKISANEKIGYGFSLAEAICKLAIALKYNVSL